MMRQEFTRLDEERQVKITELETELARVKADLGVEGALRVSDADRREGERLEDLERHEGVRAQLSDITGESSCGEWSSDRQPVRYDDEDHQGQGRRENLEGRGEDRCRILTKYVD